MKEKPTFGILISTRAFFPAWLATEARKEVLAKLDDLGYGYVIVPEDSMPNGAVETLEHARICAQLFREHRDEIDGIVIILPNFGDEKGVVHTLQFADLNVPVLVQACDDDMSKMDLKNRRDAFCGKLSVCANLNQFGIKFTNTQLHTYPINSPQFDEDLDMFSRICLTVKGLKTARLGAIGQRPDPFNTVRFSEKLLQASGITVSCVDLSEIIFGAQKMEDSDEVMRKVASIREYGRVPEHIPEANIIRQAKLGLTIEKWIKDNDIDASAIQCWSSVQDNYGCATCVTMSMMGEGGKPSACETDILGALSMYALYLAGGQVSASGYLDWNNNFDDDREKCVCTHCSNYPASFIGKKPEISNLDILGSVLGADRCFGAIKSDVEPGEVTFAKVTTDDTAGKIKVYFGEAEITEDKCHTPGGIAVVKVPGLQTLLDYICRNGFEHHVAMNRSKSSRVLEEALGNYLGWGIHRHVG